LAQLFQLLGCGGLGGKIPIQGALGLQLGAIIRRKKLTLIFGSLATRFGNKPIGTTVQPGSKLPAFIKIVPFFIQNEKQIVIYLVAELLVQAQASQAVVIKRCAVLINDGFIFL
jgi:hypothetical protein